MRASRGGDVRDWEKQEQVGLMVFSLSRLLDLEPNFSFLKHSVPTFFNQIYSNLERCGSIHFRSSTKHTLSLSNRGFFF
jgi:hypothetical protein